MKILICAIGRCENHYIREWIEHYKSINVDKIVIYDNNYDNEEYFEDVIQDYIDSGYVDIINFRNKSVCQLIAYDDCYKKYSDSYDWIGFVDCDEFIFLKNNDIKVLLSNDKYENFDALRLYWRNYDDNDLITVENNNYSCVERFKRYIESNTFKTIFKTKNQYVDYSNRKISTAHGCFCPEIKVINTRGELVNNTPTQKSTDIAIYDVAWINHYRFKTLEEFIENKLKRCYPDKTKEQAIEKGFGIKTFFQLNKLTQEKIEYLNSKGYKI